MDIKIGGRVNANEYHWVTTQATTAAMMTVSTMWRSTASIALEGQLGFHIQGRCRLYCRDNHTRMLDNRTDLLVWQLAIVIVRATAEMELSRPLR